jgi:hypothetical protein
MQGVQIQQGDLGETACLPHTRSQQYTQCYRTKRTVYAVFPAVYAVLEACCMLLNPQVTCDEHILNTQPKET